MEGNGIPDINGAEVNLGINASGAVGAHAEENASVIINAEVVTSPVQGVTEEKGNGNWSKSSLPTTPGTWGKIKAFLFHEIKVELTPRQQKIEDEINAFLFKEITFGRKKS